MPSILNKVKKIQTDKANLIEKFVQRVELLEEGIRLTISVAALMPNNSDSAVTIVRDIPMKMRRRGVEVQLIINGAYPARVDQTLLKTIVYAHKWFNDLLSGRVRNIAEIVSREGKDKSYVSRVMNLAFLAPDITENIISGRQPADLSAGKLIRRINLPLDWDKQCQLLGFI